MMEDEETEKGRGMGDRVKKRGGMEREQGRDTVRSERKEWKGEKERESARRIIQSDVSCLSL